MSKKKGNKLHPIQLQSIKVLELSIIINTENQQQELPDSGSFSLSHGHSKFDPEEKDIVLKIGVEIDENHKNSPFTLKVELIGVFFVDDSNFPIEYIDNWAEENAPLILYPYLREHVFSLTSKAGFSGILLPLFEVPVLKLDKKTP